MGNNEYAGMDYEELAAIRSEIVRDTGRIERVMETAADYGLHEARGYLQDALDAFDEELRRINEAVAMAIEKETEERVNDLLFFRP